MTAPLPRTCLRKGCTRAMDWARPSVAAFCRPCTNELGITAEPYVPERRTARATRLPA